MSTYWSEAVAVQQWSSGDVRVSVAAARGVLNRQLLLAAFCSIFLYALNFMGYFIDVDSFQLK